MTVSANRQKGMTFISICLLLGLIAFFVLLTLKIAPVYMNHSKVLDSLAGVEGMENVQSLSKHAIETSLHKRFGMNYVDHVNTDDITIFKEGNYVHVEIEYEVVKKVVGNLSILVEFYESFEVGVEE